MTEKSSGSRSQVAALFALLAAGDFFSPIRKMAARFQPALLPASIKPAARPESVAAQKSARVAPLIWLTGPSLALDGAPLSQFELASGLASSGFVVETVAASDGPLRERYAGSL